MRPAEERFWEKVDVRGLDECWLWQGFRDPTNYGKFWYRGGAQYAHRVVWQMRHGDIDKSLEIRHLCEERYLSGDITCRACCDPAHLDAGTHSENVRDSIKAQRWKFPRNPGIYSDKHLQQCASLIKNGHTQKEISEIIDTPLGSVSSLVRRLQKKHPL